MLNVVPEEERAHGTISNKTYYIYLREGASTILIMFFVIIFLVTEVSIIVANFVYLVKFLIIHRLVLLQVIGGCPTGKN